MAVVGAIPTPDPEGEGRAPTAGAGGLTDGEFTRAVEAVTSAFGDPTRRRIYLSVRDHPEGMTASKVAEEFALHANVARHHLDKLVAGGYVEVFVTPSAHAGRPSKRYRTSTRVPAVEMGRRSDDLLILLLGEALSLVPPDAAETMAERVGENYGRSMAGTLGVDPGSGSATFREALHAVADALSAHGFAAHAEARAGSLALIQEQCPFFDTARQHPVLCAVDRGMVRGMLAGLYGRTVPTSASSSRAQGDDACITVTAV